MQTKSVRLGKSPPVDDVHIADCSKAIEYLLSGNDFIQYQCNNRGFVQSVEIETSYRAIRSSLTARKGDKVDRHIGILFKQKSPTK